jgi:CMP-N-acetylneuraminic acid synthetase
MQCLAIIPARGGSKGIPDKNIAMICGHPLIAWTIQAAKAVSEIDRLIVSTDSPIISQVAQQYGADVPFLRPAELAGDDTPSMDVIFHVLDHLDKMDKYYPDYVLLLQPTSPLRTGTDIRNAINLAIEKNADSVVGVCPVSQHPYWMRTISEDGILLPFLQLPTASRRQELPGLYLPNGAIYLAHRDWILQKETFFTEQTYAYVMPPERSLDIDEPWDMHLAELILEDRKK